MSQRGRFLYQTYSLNAMFDNEKKAARRDHSRKGCFDREISKLIGIINSSADYYTTSSCAGRIVLIERKARKCDSRFILTSHKPISYHHLGQALANIGNSDAWLKVEAVIIHAVCKDHASAEKLLKMANSSGLKHSGAISLGRRIIVEIMGVDIMEAMIAQSGTVLADEKYLGILVDEANKKIMKNLGRTELFAQNLEKSLL
jgi:tRNA wybutosine-synthesizing protein 3